MAAFRGSMDIELGGKLRTMVFNFNTMADVSDRHNIPLAVILKWNTKTMTIAHIRSLVFYALKEGARMNNQEFDFTPETVGQWIVEAGGLKALDPIWDAFKSAMEAEKAKGSKAVGGGKKNG